MLQDFVTPERRLNRPKQSIWTKDITNEYVDIALTTILIALVMLSASTITGLYKAELNYIQYGI